VVGLLAVTAVLYLWGLGASGYANEFYAAAVQAGTQSWKAMFFGSIDAGNAITVDKPAFFLWPMEIAGRMFGFSSWTLLVPQALEGVAAVALLHAAVRRVSGPAAALAAGGVLALTPVAVLMFRFDNPDAMLTLLVVAALYSVVRALEVAATRWIVLAGVFIGLGFITKMGQALLVVPAMTLAYLIAAPTSLRRRITGLLGAAVAMVAAAGWYIAAVDLWPASSRPYIGGSTDNSLLELALGYNGVGRLFGGTGNGGNGGGGAGAGGNSAFGGSTGFTRLFSGDFATEISWLLPAALLAVPVGLWLTRRAPRTDLTRAALILFGGGLLATGLTFSYMQGTIHPYYTVALAPLVAGVLALTGRLLWLARGAWTARIGSAALLAVTVAWDVHLLALTPTFLPFLRPVLVVVGVVATAALLAGPWLRSGLVVAVAVAVLTSAAGSAAYAIDTAAQPHGGSIPSSGPVASAMGGPGRGGSGVMRGGPPTGFGTGDSAAGATPRSGPPDGRGGQGAGVSTDSAVIGLLAGSTTRWAAATAGAQSAASLELASGASVIAIGGFTGSDPAPTLAQFEAWVAAGEVHYFIAGGNGGGPGGGGSGSGSAIASWVAAHYTATTVGGSTVYDLTRTVPAG
jgi:4-amino-4-deoxy-L-arabinose transferase-like glycosyltransferase